MCVRVRLVLPVEIGELLGSALYVGGSRIVRSRREMDVDEGVCEVVADDVLVTFDRL